MGKARKLAKGNRAPRQTPVRGGSRAPLWLLATLAALCVARPLIPCEGAAWMGDDLPFDLLLLLLCVGCSAWMLGQRGLTRKPGAADLCVAALVGISVVSALVGAQFGSPRAAVNMVWQWVGAGAIFFLVRQLVITPSQTRALVAVMFALAVALSGLGLHQVFVSLPADRAAYAVDPDATLRALGQWFPPGSPERLRFEQRLQSTEPLGTFALTNSLAGFLAPWLIVALGAAWSWFRGDCRQGAASIADRVSPRAPRVARIAALAVCLFLVSACLVLTKSRSGFVAVGVGLGVLPFVVSARHWRWNWKIAGAGAGAVLALALSAWAIGGLDAKVVTEATKSLGYRLQYWQSTLRMIGRHPWLGVGPGNFQDYYTQFKLPEASEEVRDPHNFLFEVWSTSGTVALVALLAILVLLAKRTRFSQGADGEVNAISTSAEQPSERWTWSCVLLGAAVGPLLAFALGPLVGLPVSIERVGGTLLLGGALVVLAWPWIVGGVLPRRLPALGVLVLCLHLLAAGSISFPGVAQSFWVLIALALNQSEPLPVRRNAIARQQTPWLPLASMTLSSVGVVACYLSGYQPVLALRAALARFEDTASEDFDSRRMALRAAAAADPLSAEPWLAIAELELERARGSDNGQVRQAAGREFAVAIDRFLKLRPRSSAAWAQAARLYEQAAGEADDAPAALSAAELLRRAVKLYPSSATLRAQHALALARVEQSAAAQAEAEEALRLDVLTPHVDKKLSVETRQRLKSLISPPR